eukprot:5746984-Pyramimonas_sp.AAC.1
MGETNCELAVVGGAQMVAVRMTDMVVALKGTTRQKIAVLIDMNSNGQHIVHSDHLTDCKD